jgi:hypothetical protein
MRIQIFSMMAAIAGREDVQWDGDLLFDHDGVPFPASTLVKEPGFAAGLPNGAADNINDRLWRVFQRVEDYDGERLAVLGYRLPSLSLGDFVTWSERTWQVTSRGFELVTGNRDHADRLIRQNFV